MAKCSILAVSFIREVNIVIIKCACGREHNYRITKETPCPPPAEK